MLTYHMLLYTRAPTYACVRTFDTVAAFIYCHHHWRVQYLERCLACRLDGRLRYSTLLN